MTEYDWKQFIAFANKFMVAGNESATTADRKSENMKPRKKSE